MSLSPKPLAPKRSTPNIRNLQTAFETPPQSPTRDHPHAIYPPNAYHRSYAGDLAPTANMATKRIPSLAKSIDAVLDTPAAPSTPASPPNRPLAKLRPSWIGPQPSKPMKADIAGHLEAAMKQRVSIEFASPGLQPPVYIFTSLSDPEWTATEMFPVKQMNGDFTFVRNFDVEEGEYQYKFRLGPGDWWVCDDKKEIVDDGAGNRNNRVVVTSVAKKAVDSGHASPEPEVAAAPKLTSGLMPKPATHAEPVVTPPADETQRVPLSTKVQEAVPSPEKVASEKQSAKPATKDAEKGPIGQTAVPKIAHPFEDNQDFESEAEPYTAPLLRHESVSPTSHEQDHAPLFRHESIALGYNHHEDAAPHPSNESSTKSITPAAMAALSTAKEADPNKASLHPFPTDHQGILDHIHSTHTRLPADETSEGVIMSSPASSAVLTDSSSVSGSPMLPSVGEEDEELERIREAGEQEADEEKENGEELDPLKEGEATNAEDADFEAKVPELKVVVVPKIEKTTEEIVILDRRLSLTDIAEKAGTRNLMAVAVGLLAVIAATAVWKLFR